MVQRNQCALAAKDMMAKFIRMRTVLTAPSQCESTQVTCCWCFQCDTVGVTCCHFTPTLRHWKYWGCPVTVINLSQYYTLLLQTVHFLFHGSFKCKGHWWWNLGMASSFTLSSALIDFIVLSSSRKTSSYCFNRAINCVWVVSIDASPIAFQSSGLISLSHSLPMRHGPFCRVTYKVSFFVRSP